MEPVSDSQFESLFWLKEWIHLAVFSVRADLNRHCWIWVDLCRFSIAIVTVTPPVHSTKEHIIVSCLFSHRKSIPTTQKCLVASLKFTTRWLGAQQQCCYDQQGYLMFTDDWEITGDYNRFFNPASPVRAHNFGAYPYKQPPRIPGLSNYMNDLMPFYICCQYAQHCEFYYWRRQTHGCQDYGPPAACEFPKLLPLEMRSWLNLQLYKFSIHVGRAARQNLSVERVYLPREGLLRVGLEWRSPSQTHGTGQIGTATRNTL